MLDLATLKATLQPIRQIGEVEERFEIKGTSVVMRVLNPKEELEIQRWAQRGVLEASPEDQEKDNSLAVEYLNKFKLGCLSYSIVEVNGLDLRDQDFVSTGEVLPNGQAVKIKRTEAVRGMLEDWPRPLLTAVFRKFNEIMERCEINSDKAVEFNPPDLESEIQRVLQRLQTLEEMREGKETARAVSLETPTYATEQPTPTPQETATTAPTVPTPQETAPQERRSAIPTSATAVEPQAPLPVVETTPTPTPETAETNNTVINASGATGTLAANEGWVDKGDSDSMEAIVAAENARLMEMRSRRPNQDANIANAVSAQTFAPTSEAAEITGREVEASQNQVETSTNPRFVPPAKR